MQKIIVILGPTASGKSALAVDLAMRFDGEIISADSRQVYRGLDIATGKVTKEEMQGIPHHLLDVADPQQTFTASDFVEQGRAAIEGIALRGKLPIVCGGTGFYIDAIVGRISIPEVLPDESLRKELALKSAPELFNILSNLDPVRAESIERENPVRLIRAIEIATALGSVPPRAEGKPLYDTLWIGLARPQDELHARIHARVLFRLDHGMIAEAEELRQSGLSYERMRELGLEYRLLADYLEGLIGTDELAIAIERGDLQYAKRQMTYWKRNASIEWHEPAELAAIIERTERFLAK